MNDIDRNTCIFIRKKLQTLSMKQLLHRFTEAVINRWRKLLFSCTICDFFQ